MSRGESLYWPAEFGHQRSYKDEVYKLRCVLACDDRNPPTRWAAWKAAQHFKLHYGQTLPLNPEAPPKKSVSVVWACPLNLFNTESNRWWIYSLRNLLNRDLNQRKDFTAMEISSKWVGGKSLPLILGSSKTLHAQGRGTLPSVCMYLYIDCVG